MTRRLLGLAFASMAFVSCSKPSESKSTAASADSTPPVAAANAAPQGDSTQRYLYYWCLPQRDATLAGIGTHSDTSELSALGAARSRTVGSGEDDGGEYVTSILTFDRVEVEIDSRGFGIERVETSDPKVDLSGVVRVGMSLSAALDSLGVPSSMRELAKGTPQRMWVASVCEGSDVPLMPSELSGVRLYVDGANRVLRVALTKYGP